MARTPVPQLGIDLQELLVYGLNVSESGVLTTDFIQTINVPAPDIRNVGRGVNVAGDVGHQEINAMNTRQRNQVIVDDGYTLEVKAYNVNNGTDPSPLLTMWQEYDYYFVTWLEGTAPGAIYTNEFYGVRGSIDKPFEDRGMQVTTIHFAETDPGYPTVKQYRRYLSG